MPDTAQAPAALALPAPAAALAPAPAATQAPPLAVNAAEAARLLGIGKSLFYSMLATERFGPRPVRLGRAVRFSRIEIEAWIAAGAPPRARWEVLTKGGRR